MMMSAALAASAAVMTLKSVRLSGLPARAAGSAGDDDLAAAVPQVLRLRMPLAAVADDRDTLTVEN